MERQCLLKLGGGGNFSKWNEEQVSKTTQKFVVQSLKSYPTLCEPMNCSTLGFPFIHYLLEFAQIHIHCDSDAISNSPLILELMVSSDFK